MLTREEQIKKNQMARMPKEKKTPKPIAKVSEKKKAQIAEEKAAGTDGEMDLFFDAMLKKCTGKCLFCNSKTTAADTSFWRDDNEKWSQEANDRNHERRIEVMRRASIAHLFPKSLFKSIATHEDNWIELCWNCHTMFDSGKITWEFIRDSAEWEFIKEKLLTVLPMVHQEDRKVKLYSKLEQLVYNNKQK
jgi:hypothetical protein